MTIEFKNTPIYYQATGQGPVMVLLHGFLESVTMWEPLLPLLSEKHRVINIDLPGHGKSGVIAETHSMELMAEAVLAVLDKLNISSATFLGHSMGGYVALAFAEAYGKRVEKLILLNSTPAEDSPERKENRNRAIEVITKNPRVFISMAISNLFAESSHKKFATKIEQLKNEAFSFPIEGILAAVRGMRDRKDRIEMLKFFPKKKYIISAKEDPIIPLDEVKSLSFNCKAKLKIISGGHMSVIENLPNVKKYVLFID